MHWLWTFSKATPKTVHRSHKLFLLDFFLLIVFWFARVAIAFSRYSIWILLPWKYFFCRYFCFFIISVSMLVASIDTNFGHVFETTVLCPRGAVPRPRPLVRITETRVVVHSRGVCTSCGEKNHSIIKRFNFFRYIVFTVYIDIAYI